MFFNQVKRLVDSLRAKGLRNDYIVNSIKEYLQLHALSYIYNNKEYNRRLIFTGGTCLRFCFNLPRLSEDIDFDYEDGLNFEKLQIDIEQHFKGSLRFPALHSALKGQNKKIYLKFPILKELALSFGDSQILYLKIEPSQAPLVSKNIEITPINREGLYFFIRRYSLPDLMSGKITAFLTRSFFKGKKNEIDFKGRDIFDLIWYMGQGIQPNLERLTGLLKGTLYQDDNWGNILVKIRERLIKIKREYITIDLQQFIEDQGMVDNFLDSHLQVFEQYYQECVGKKIG
ncbi:MAG: nucleotidyl transferase AbiEii/AbiGii toxin family protein [bacterium]